MIVIISAIVVFAMSGTLAYADRISDAVEGAATGFQATAQGAAKWLLVIGIVVLGAVFLIGSQRQKENQKEQVWEKVAGVALIVCAVPIAGIVFGWF